MPALTLAVMVLATLPARAIDIKVQTKVSPPTATVGDRIRLEVIFQAPPAVRFTPVLSGTTYADWDIVDIKRHPAKFLDDGIAESRFVFTLIPWSATLTATPALPFNAIQPPGRVQAVLIKPHAIKMESVLAKAEDTSDLRPPKGVIGYRSWWPWLLALAAVVLAVAGWWLKARKKRRALQAQAPRVPAVPPERTARQALDALLASSLLEEGNVKPFYSQLSDIFRRYVEGRFHLPALDRTTAELLPELRQRDELRPLFTEVRFLLESCDLVKFAKYVPDPGSVQADVERVRKFVDHTSPRPSVLTPVGAAS